MDIPKCSRINEGKTEVLNIIKNLEPLTSTHHKFRQHIDFYPFNSCFSIVINCILDSTREMQLCCTSYQYMHFFWFSFAFQFQI